MMNNGADDENQTHVTAVRRQRNLTIRHQRVEHKSRVELDFRLYQRRVITVILRVLTGAR
jgi:hypothetical protein